MKTLYFEGAGWPETEKEYGLNCRIRTAFTNDKGNKIYLEILCGHKDKIIMKGPKYEDIPDHYMMVDSCHYITEDIENVQSCRGTLVTNKEGHTLERNGNRSRPYTKEEILKFVNKECGCSFDTVEVLPEFAGYRVHKDSSRAGTAAGYNFGDEFPYDEERTRKIATRVKELKQYYSKLFNQRFDNTSYWRDGNDLHIWINVSEQAMKDAGITKRKYIEHF